MTVVSPAPVASPAEGPAFATLPLPAAVLDNLQRLGWTRMTPIQAASLPLTLAGHDLIAQSRTGSGKTAAFALPLLARVDIRNPAVQAMVLCPTRELADQVAQEIRRLARAEDNVKVLTLCGGATMRPQLASLAHGAHVVVGTPGRIGDHLGRGSLVLDGLATLVLDEADRLLEMGFAEDIAAIARHCPPASRRQTLLFSATYPDAVGKLASRYLHEPREVRLAEPAHAGSTVEERWYEITESTRLHTVGRLLDRFRPPRTIAFCNTRQQCRDLAAVLQAQGLVAMELHGELDQRDRDQVLVQFAHGSCSVLVATDVAARGLDIAGLEAVISVDVTPEPAVHVHRIGRTGRAGASGQAFGLASPDEMGRVGRIEALVGREFTWHPPAELEAGPPRGTDPGPLRPPMVTLQILGGRKDRIRAGDVLGALTKDIGLPGTSVGRIDLNDHATYVAVRRDVADQALHGLNAGRVKGRSVKARRL